MADEAAEGTAPSPSPAPAPQPQAPAAQASAQQGGPQADAHKGVPLAAPAAPVEVTRPDYVPEKFWDAEKKAPRLEDLGKSYAELERRHHMRTDDLRKTVESEVRDGLYKDRPATPKDYKLEPSKGFLPDGMKFEANPDDPFLKAITEIGHQRGMSQDDFSHLVDGYLESLSSQFPDPVAELRALGPKAASRVENAKMWAEANIPPKQLKALGAVTMTAAGIELVEWVRDQIGEPRLGDLSVSGLSSGTAALTAETLTQMQADDRYWNPQKRDPAFVKRVADGWKRLSTKVK